MKLQLRIALLALTMFAGTAVAQNQKTDNLLQWQKLNFVFRYLTENYVDEVDAKPLVESAVREMLSGLDPHSAYMDSEQTEDAMTAIEGEFGGIGIEFNILRDTVVVVNTIAGGPAEAVGVRADDRIVRIDTLSAVGLRSNEVPKYLRGEKGSSVEIGVLRRGVDAPLNFRITRDNIPINTVSAAYKATDRTGYIKIDRFGRTTYKEFAEAFSRLKKDGIGSLILDLRGNGGGLMESAIEVAGFFLPKETTVVSTEGRAVESRDYAARNGGVFTKGSVAVLIDESSASGSEIVAGALQDWDRAVVIGRTSFGKGLVQRQIPFPDGSAIRVTIARYHTPSGRVIQRPYENGRSDEYYAAHRRRYSAGDDSHADTTSAPKYKTLILGRTVYGGGGIEPDEIVESDTTEVSKYLVEMVMRGVIREYVMQLLDGRRAEYEARYPDFETFDTLFEFDSTMRDDLAALGEEHNVTRDIEGFIQSERIIKMQIKALIAQKLFSTTEFYRVVNADDERWFGRALELVEGQ
ncbi:MAG: S41 family peptidase [Alistipes sp.]|nr:S41 family peptidase [Alistipes sp.]